MKTHFNSFYHKPTPGTAKNQVIAESQDEPINALEALKKRNEDQPADTFKNTKPAQTNITNYDLIVTQLTDRVKTLESNNTNSSSLLFPNEIDILDRVSTLETKQAALETQLTSAYRLIALNMFAIVRMELGTSTDKIINDALTVKRHHTGKGNAKVATECVAAMAMMAGNILSAGGLAAVGQIIGGVAVLTKGIVLNNFKNAQDGIAEITAGSMDLSTKAGREQKGDYDQHNYGGVGQNMTTSTLNHLTSTSVNFVGSGVNAITTKKRASIDSFVNYDNKKNHIAYCIPYGSGGAHAITQDVKCFISNAYKDMINTIDQQQLNDYGDRSVLQLLATRPENNDPTNHQRYATNSLHPLTTYVLENALGNLIVQSTAYKKCKSKSKIGTWATANMHDYLGYAQHAVTVYYKDVRTKIVNDGSFDLGEDYYEKKNQQAKKIFQRYDEDGQPEFNSGPEIQALIDAYKKKQQNDPKPK